MFTSPPPAVIGWKSFPIAMPPAWSVSTSHIRKFCLIMFCHSDYKPFVLSCCKTLNFLDGTAVAEVDRFVLLTLHDEIINIIKTLTNSAI